MLKINIRKRPLANGEMSLYLDCRDGDRRWYESTGLVLIPESSDNDKRQNKNALANAVKIKAQRILGIEQEKPTDDVESASSPTLVAYIEHYLKVKNDNEGLSDSHKRHLKCFSNFLLNYLAKAKKKSTKMNRVNKTFLQAFFKYLKDDYQSTKSETPKPLSPSTRNLYHQYTSAMLNHAVREGIIKSNPMKQLEKREKKVEYVTERDFLTKEEVKALFDIETNAPQTRDAFLFCCFTGLRVSDVSSMTWGQIKSGVSGQYISMMMTKTKKLITVPIGKMAMRFLPAYDMNDKESKVFDLPGLSSINRSLKRMAKKAGIEKDLHFHISRHTFATLSLAAGVDIATVSSILGHTAIRTTQLYAKVLDAAKVNAIGSMERLYS